MFLVQILLPLADNQGQPFGRGAFEKVKDGLAEKFDGVTAFTQSPGEGLWTEGSGKTEDDVVVFEVMVESLDHAQWTRLKGELERDFRQEKVIIRHIEMGLF